MSWFSNLFGKKTTTEEKVVEEPVFVEKAVEEEVFVEKPEYEFIEPLDLMKVSFVASPNKSKRKGAVKYIVLHHTGPGSFSGIVKWLCNPAAKASAHYVLSVTGQLKQLVNTKWESWHAGVAKINGQKLNNHCSIGIEICNIGLLDEIDGSYYYTQGRQTKKYTGKVQPEYGLITYPSGAGLAGYYVPYPEKQITKLVALCKALVEKYPEITRENIITHYDIGFPEGRKNDPFGIDIERIRDMVFQTKETE